MSKSTRILALLGAGLSASSGLPTFRGAGGLWRTHDAVQLATPEAFQADPGLVWQFYSYRRHMALKAKPNPAHYALAELARKREGFLTLSQNVDGMFTLSNSSDKYHKLTHNRPLSTRQPSQLAAKTPPRLPLRRQMLRLLLQPHRTQQLHRPHSPRSRHPNRRIRPDNNIRHNCTRIRYIRRERRAS